ncbi:unnamed protein product [Dicrocoelium dendriticum]|nr:unnamed protein product [Dicrocoelium dendriticum]
MQALEQVALPIARPKLWIRYVDDTFVILKRSKLEETHELINSVFDGTQFTREEENNEHLPFLDVLIRRTGAERLKTTVYRKSTHTDQILNYGSNHPAAHKRSCVQTLFKRAQTHCSTPQLRRAEEDYLFNLLKRNSYTKGFILRCLASQKVARHTSTNVTAEKRTTLPYVNGISEMATRLLLPFEVKVAHQPTEIIRSKLFKVNDKLSKEEETGVIYKICCRNCDKYYVGQTGRKLGTRLHEHCLAVRRHDQNSLMSVHMDAENHQFDIEHVSIPGRPKSRQACEFIEVRHSK